MRAPLPLLTLAFFSCVLAGAEPTADDRKAAVEVLRKEADRRAKLFALEKEWAKKKDAATVEKLKNLRAEMKGWRFDRPEDLAEPLVLSKAGEVGTFPHKKARVREVIDKNTALIETRTNRAAGDRDDDITLFVAGVDTSKWADDLAIDAPAGIWIVTTQKHEGRTYLRLSPLVPSKDESAALLKAAKP